MICALLGTYLILFKREILKNKKQVKSQELALKTREAKASSI